MGQMSTFIFILLVILSLCAIGMIICQICMAKCNVSLRILSEAENLNSRLLDELIPKWNIKYNEFKNFIKNSDNLSLSEHMRKLEYFNYELDNIYNEIIETDKKIQYLIKKAEHPKIKLNDILHSMDNIDIFMDNSENNNL